VTAQPDVRGGGALLADTVDEVRLIFQRFDRHEVTATLLALCLGVGPAKWVREEHPDAADRYKKHTDRAAQYAFSAN